MEQTASSVRKLTEICISKFEQLLALQNQRRTELVESRLADFNLWADGVGALAKPGASLDSRLQGRADDLALVKNVLIMLADSLDYYTGLAENDANSDGAIQNLDSAIKNLALIGVAIRRTGKASRNRRADRTFNPDEHHELRKHLECVILLRPTEEALFRPTEDGRYVAELDASKLSDLQSRLIEANLRRRHNFLLAQKRSRTQKGVQTQLLTTAVPSSADDLLQGRPPADTQNAADLQDPTINPTSKGKDCAATTISGFSRASTAEGTLQYAQAAKRYTPGLAKTQITFIASDAEFPRAPSIPLGRELSKCPCCCQSLPVETFSNPKIWKQHVIEDLCPYTCIAENCPTPQLLFCTRNEWESHVKKSHLPQWQCPFCEEQDEDYPTMESMGSHLQTDHERELLDNSLSTLLSWSAVQTVGIKSCPLCSSHGPEDSPELVDHVLRHAYEFALRALPWPQPVAHDLNVPAGSFHLPEDSENAGYLQGWVNKAVHQSQRSPGLKLCAYDTADHSVPAPSHLSEYSDYFITNSYFDDRPEDKSFRPQGDQSIASNYSTASIWSSVAASLASASQETSQTKLRADHPDTLTSMADLADALQAACFRGNKDTVQMLLDQGADVNAQGGENGTALQAACFRGNKETVQMLLDQGADVNAPGGQYGNALQTACYYGYKEIVQILLDRGADVNAQGSDFGNALQAACSHGNKEIVQMLLDQGVDVNVQGGRYRNALHAASFNGYKDIVQILLGKGAR